MDGDTRWESFAKAGMEGNKQEKEGGKSVRFGGDGEAEGGGGDKSINEQLTATMERLIEKNIELTEEFESFRERSSRELATMEENALKEKDTARELQETLDELRLNVGGEVG